MHIRRWPRRWANRVLIGVLILGLAVLAAGEFYDHSRVDAILQGRLNLAQAQIDANGLTLTQAEADISRVLATDRADITALQREVAALEAQNAQLEQEIAALQAALGSQGSSPSPTGHPSPTAAPTASPRPSPPICVSIVCLGNRPHAASCAHASTRHPC